MENIPSAALAEGAYPLYHGLYTTVVYNIQDWVWWGAHTKTNTPHRQSTHTAQRAHRIVSCKSHMRRQHQPRPALHHTDTD